MDYKAWFERNDKYYIPDNHGLELEELYQAIKARLMDELVARVEYGRSLTLKDKK